MEENILMGLTVVILSMALYYLLQGIRYKNDKNEKIRSEARQDIIWGSFLIVTGILIAIYTYYLHPREIAQEMLKTQDTTEYNNLCESLFKLKADKATYNQFLEMKAKSPQGEVTNLCGNFAKNILDVK